MQKTTTIAKDPFRRSRQRFLSLSLSLSLSLVRASIRHSQIFLIIPFPSPALTESSPSLPFPSLPFLSFPFPSAMAAGGSNGDDRVVATAHQILRTLSASHTDDMLRILSTFDDRFSRFSLPRNGAGPSPLASMAESSPSRDQADPDPRDDDDDGAEQARSGEDFDDEEDEEIFGHGDHDHGRTHPALRSAQETIMRWDFGSSELARQTFLWSDQRDQVPEYLDAVDNVQSLIDTLSSSSSSSLSEPSSALDHAQNVLQFAMLRLEAELSQILEKHSKSPDPDLLFNLLSSRSSFNGNGSSRRAGDDGTAPLDGIANEDDSQDDTEQVAKSRSITDMTIDLLPVDVVADLCDIVTRMIRSGYQTECSQVYIGIRKSTLEESLQKLGHEKLTFEEVQRMPWDLLENEIGKWIQIMKISIGALFPSEKQLCYKIFAESLSDAESCFNDVSKAALMQLLNFAEAIAIGRRAPEKLFKILDMYEAVRDMIPAIDSIFEGEGCANLRSELTGILSRLGDAARGTFSEFENAIQKETSKTPVPGGAVHPLARYVMNYLRFMSDYTETLNQLLWDRREVHLDSSNQRLSNQQQSPLSTVSTNLMELLERSLDAKSKLYKDSALACLFLMNNVHYIGQKVKDSEIRKLLGDEWIKRNNGKLRQYHNNYRRTAWTKVLSYLTDEGINISGGSASGASRNVLKERFKNFNAAFEENVKTQSSWIVSDPQLSAELRISITGMILPAYRSFLGRFQNHLDVVRHPLKYVKYTPEDLEAYLLNDLFEGSSGSMNRRKSFPAAGSAQ